LEGRAVVGDTSNTVNDIVDELLANGVVAAGIYMILAGAYCLPEVVIISQLLAASSLPLIRSSGWNSDLYWPVRISSMGYPPC
jgi:hypothetical protein